MWVVLTNVSIDTANQISAELNPIDLECFMLQDSAESCVDPIMILCTLQAKWALVALSNHI
jgi:hypothetical protein